MNARIALLLSCLAPLVFIPVVAPGADVAREKEKEPALVDPGPAGGPPADAVVLFNGRDLAAWRSGNGSEPKWKILEDASMQVQGGDLMTREEFGDVQLHVGRETFASLLRGAQGLRARLGVNGRPGHAAACGQW